MRPAFRAQDRLVGTVFHVDLHLPGTDLGRQLRGPVQRAVSLCLGRRSGQYAREHGRVGDHIGQLLRQPALDRVTAGSQCIEHCGQHLVEGDRPQVQVERPGVQAAQLVEIRKELDGAAHRRPGCGEEPGLLRIRTGAHAAQRFVGRTQRAPQVAARGEEE
ncbi:hypothetical protein [Streptomyces sp. NBC_00503]|uniref:hypothetical protein n=1 Tax=Streptomyces sp. NBC_00503 TaxID=2903659 RepID=UPI002E802CFE|nr:hypothetical protein [Streptomyces sp. NBC_00503]WUD84874.1 hypothetical protein OG490_32380 [Streptomyces sp. NBC_00503]